MTALAPVLALLALLVLGARAQHSSEWTYSGKHPAPGPVAFLVNLTPAGAGLPA